jgi:CysZ protein
MVRLMTSFGKGVGDMAWALALLARSPKLWGYVIAPALVAALLSVAVLYFLFGPLLAYADQVTAWLPGWLSFVGGILRALVLVALAGAAYVVFLATTALCTAPFCEQLSESVEISLGGETPPGFSVATLLKDLVLGISHSIRRIVSYLLVMAALFLAALIVPVVGALIFTVGGAWVTTRFTAYDALDAVWARKSLAYDDKMARLQQVRSRAYGIGAITALLMAVPIANFVAMPLAAIAATRLHVEELSPPHVSQEQA